MKYLKYPKYKDSGIEWIGEIPEHWTLLKLKYMALCLDYKRIPLNAEERSYRDGQVEYWGANGVVGYIDNYLFNDELVLIGEDGAPFNEKYREVAFYVDYPIWPNNHIHVLKAKERVLPNYLKHSLNSSDFTDFIEGSTRDKLTQSNLLEIPIPLCDLKEQMQILSFLENQTSKINILISKQQQLIELLKEKRQAIITHAVTKGLDPNVPMKDSGIEWVGEIPERWKVTPLKFVSLVIMGQSPPSEHYTELGVIPFLQGCAEFGAVSPDPKHYCDIATKLSQPGDILLSVRAPVGEINLSDKVYGIGRGLCAIRSTSAEQGYIRSWLEAAKGELKNVSTGSTYDAVAVEDVKNLKISIPCSGDEQKIVLDFLNLEISKVDSLISKQQQMIELLKEHKTSLITQAVTGKIDVRDLIQEVKRPAGQTS